MHKRLFLVFFLFHLHLFVYAEKIHYDLPDSPIDVVIVSHPKDQVTIDDCINGIKNNSINPIRRVIVVSPIKLTEQAEWFDEKLFPFTKDDIAFTIARGDKILIKQGFSERHSPGWYYQQLLKLYSPFVIPDISSNVLIIDADTIFMNRVAFLNDQYGGYFCFRKKEGRGEYFEHAQRLVPGYKRIYPQLYSVCHHMLFQKPILQDLFDQVEATHQTEFWRAFCLCVDLKEKGGASEYEIYYNFALSHSDQVALRGLKWKNSAHLSKREVFKTEGYHFVAFHTYLRNRGAKLQTR